MIWIAHRGNVSGRIPDKENDPDYLEHALNAGYEVECDVRRHKGKLYLGHDEPQYPINMDFFQSFGVWVHCKDMDSLRELIGNNFINCFFHENDHCVLTSKRFIWCYPGHYVEGGIIVKPEVCANFNLKMAAGICTDNITEWRAKLEEVPTR